MTVAEAFGMKTKYGTICECFNDISVFTFFMSVIVMLTNALVVGYRSSVITTIERRYEFSSVFSGLLSGALELGSLVATLFVSYFCARSHIPRCIGVASLICGVGSLLYAFPHVLSERPKSMASLATTGESSTSSVFRDEIMCRTINAFKPNRNYNFRNLSSIRN